MYGGLLSLLSNNKSYQLLKNTNKLRQNSFYQLFFKRAADSTASTAASVIIIVIIVVIIVAIVVIVIIVVIVSAVNIDCFACIC